jgi:hypothetical protein
VVVETRAHPPHVFNRLANRIADIAQALGRLTGDQRLDLLMRMRPAAYKAWDLYQAGFVRASRRIAKSAVSAVRSWSLPKDNPSHPAVAPEPVDSATFDSIRVAVSRANKLAIHGYLPKPFGFPVACLWAAEEPMDQGMWRSLVRDITLEAVPGNHNTCITTQVETLGRAMRTALEEAQKRRQALPRPATAPVQAVTTAKSQPAPRMASAG